MDWANERRRYNIASSLIGWAHTQNNPDWVVPIKVHSVKYVHACVVSLCSLFIPAYAFYDWACGNVYVVSWEVFFHICSRCFIGYHLSWGKFQNTDVSSNNISSLLTAPGITWTNTDSSLVGFCGIHLRASTQTTSMYNEFENILHKWLPLFTVI